MKPVTLKETASKYIIDIRLGLDTNKKLADKYGVGTSAITSSLRTARNAGVVTYEKCPIESNSASYYKYSVDESIPFIVHHKKSGINSETAVNKYEEDLYPKLNFFLYKFKPPEIRHDNT